MRFWIANLSFLKELEAKLPANVPTLICEHRRRARGSTTRCAAGALVPGSPALADPPKNIYLPEVAWLAVEQLHP